MRRLKYSISIFNKLLNNVVALHTFPHFLFPPTFLCCRSESCNLYVSGKYWLLRLHSISGKVYFPLFFCSSLRQISTQSCDENAHCIVLVNDHYQHGNISQKCCPKIQNNWWFLRTLHFRLKGGLGGCCKADLMLVCLGISHNNMHIVCFGISHNIMHIVHSLAAG